MNVFTIAALGLSLEDSLVLRSALRFVGDRRCRWRCVEDASDAEVVLTLSPAARDDRGEPLPGHDTEPRQRLRLAINAPGADLSPANLMLPLRARDLLPHLGQAQLALERLSQRHGSEPLQSEPRSLVNLMLSHAGPLGRTPVLMRVGARGALLIESSSAIAPADVRSLGWRSWSIPDLATLCDQIRRGGSMSLEPARSRSGESSSLRPLCAGTVAQLIWALALHDPRPELAAGLRADLCFALTRWPDVDGMSLEGAQLRMAALLARRTVSLPELVARSKVGERDAIAFLNACHWMGCLAAASDVPAKVAARPAARGLGVLVESIRSALRGAVVRESR